MSETTRGIVGVRTHGGTGVRAMWLWTSSIASLALNGTEPVSIS